MYSINFYWIIWLQAVTEAHITYVILMKCNCNTGLPFCPCLISPPPPFILPTFSPPLPPFAFPSFHPFLCPPPSFPWNKRNRGVIKALEKEEKDSYKYFLHLNFRRWVFKVSTKKSQAIGNTGYVVVDKHCQRTSLQLITVSTSQHSQVSASISFKIDGEFYVVKEITTSIEPLSVTKEL